MGNMHKRSKNLPNVLGEGAAPPSTRRQSPALAVVERIEQCPTDRLRKFDRNARTHSEAQINQIAASIREFGFVNPVLIGPDDTIIAGHARLLAARTLNMSTIPVIVLSHLSVVQRRALVIADNQLALTAGWDEDMLRTELAALKDEPFGLQLLGFDDAELARLLAADSQQPGPQDPDAAPAVPQTPVTAPGDLWVLGDHRLLCGDATRREVIDMVLSGGQADMVFADPPDHVSPEGKICRNATISENCALREGYQGFLEAACANLIAVCPGAIYVCGSSSEFHTLRQAFTAAGGHWSAFVIWAEPGFTPGQSDYSRQYQPILYGWREGSDHYWCGARDQGDVWMIPRLVATPQHLAMKPVELIERAVENSSRRGDTVLDPFAGSGSTLIACERRQRRARLIEVDPLCTDGICQRWEQYTGQPAIRQADGVAFSELTRERREHAT
jgi:DNA modification methylase